MEIGRVKSCSFKNPASILIRIYMTNIIIAKLNSLHESVSVVRGRTKVKIIHNSSNFSSAVIYVRIVKSVIIEIIPWWNYTGIVHRLENFSRR